jgi:hypothetical protein
MHPNYAQRLVAAAVSARRRLRRLLPGTEDVAAQNAPNYQPLLPKNISHSTTMKLRERTIRFAASSCVYYLSFVMRARLGPEAARGSQT